MYTIIQIEGVQRALHEAKQTISHVSESETDRTAIVAVDCDCDTKEGNVKLDNVPQERRCLILHLTTTLTQALTYIRAK